MTEGTSAKRERFYLLLLLCVNVALPVVLIAKYRAGEISRYNSLVSAAMCTVLINGAMVYGFWKSIQKTDDKGTKKLFVAAAVLAVFGFLTTFWVVSHADHHGSDLDLAMSDTPLASIEPARQRFLVELIRQTAANSRENDKLVAEVRQHPLNPQVYTAESFANTETMNHTVGRLTDIVQADAAYYAKQQAAKQHFREELAPVDPEYLRSWDNSDRSRVEAQAFLEKLQQDWLASVVSLYAYAQGHFQEISAKDGTVQLGTPADDAVFQKLLNQSKNLHHQLLQGVQQGIDAQKQSSRNLVTP